MPAITVPLFALTWWAACYLVGREPGQRALRRAPWRAAGALVAYALGVALWTVAPEAAPAHLLFAATPLLWAGAALALLPESVPERRPIELVWLVLSPILLVMAAVLPPTGRLVVLAPLVGALVLLGRFRDQVRPPMLPAALAVAAVLFAAGLAVLQLPVEAGLTLAALGLDLLMLAFLVAVAEALDLGERLRPDLVRAVTAALAGVLLVGGPAALTMVAADRSRIVTVLQFVVVAVVMTLIGLAGPLRRLLDGLIFRHDERLREERSALLVLAAALPRHRQRHRLITIGEEDFRRFVGQALVNCRDVDRLVRSPLTDLPAVDQRLTGRAIERPLARAMELRTLLQESVDRLRPPGPIATSDDWHHYNALYFCSVLGLDPHRRQRTDGLDLPARQALEWIRRFVPRRVLRRWQREGTALVAAHLWEDLISTDPRWLTRVPSGKRHAST